MTINGIQTKMYKLYRKMTINGHNLHIFEWMQHSYLADTDRVLALDPRVIKRLKCT